MAKILVTGGSGFIGAPLVRELKGDHDVVTLRRDDGDIADPRTLARLGPVDHVFHLAARTFVPDSWKDPVGFLTTNVVGTANVLAFCRRVSASLTFVSAYLYGKPERLPIPEAATPRPNNPYAMSKHLAEQLCQFAATYDGLTVSVVRPFNIYGAGQASHFLIPTVVQQLRAGGPIRVMDLVPKRDYLHIDDLVRLLVATVSSSGQPYRVFNAGSGESYSVQEIIDTVQIAAGTRLPVIVDGGARYEEIADVRADISAARAQFGWEPRVALNEGIAGLLAVGGAE